MNTIESPPYSINVAVFETTITFNESAMHVNRVSGGAGMMGCEMKFLCVAVSHAGRSVVNVVTQIHCLVTAPP